TFLAFVVLLHVGTAIALVIYFWRDWLAIVRAVLRSVIAGQLQGTTDERLGWRLILATIPAGVVGTLLQKQVQALFASPRAAAVFLIINGVIMFGGERLRRHALAAEEGRTPLDRLSVRSAVAAFLSVAYLMRYFRVGRLDPFAIYCAAFGILSLILLSR